MTKDEMKNRISMTLKDPILQQGFEIICKENKELKADNDARKFAMVMSEKVEKQLREENAELKRDKEDLIFIRNQNAKCMCEDKEKLTKAKEHIENLLYYVKQCTCERSNYEEIGKDIKEAEQFLKEIHV